MLVRHFCWKSKRMALISVPAWPMPIHQTKLMIPNAQATGMLLPQVPIPFASVMEMAAVNRPVPAIPMEKSISQPRDGLRQTKSLSVLLSVPSSCSPWMSDRPRSCICASVVMPAPGWDW